MSAEKSSGVRLAPRRFGTDGAREVAVEERRVGDDADALEVAVCHELELLVRHFRR